MSEEYKTTKNVLVTGGIPEGTWAKSTSWQDDVLTEDEETTIRINVMEANEVLREARKK